MQELRRLFLGLMVLGGGLPTTGLEVPVVGSGSLLPCYRALRALYKAGRLPPPTTGLRAQ